KPEILFWVGCAGSLDDRAQVVSKSLARLMQIAGIQFAILGNEEACTGDPARRSGNEFLFQMLAQQNIQTLDNYGVKRIVTACPHCFNTLKNEYPELGGQYEVVHHVQLLDELLEKGKIPLSSPGREVVTYHDSCYMGRVNGIYDAPRNILKHLRVELKEMPRCGSNGLCCGAGGAQMFKEEESGDRRVNRERVDEAIRTGATTIAANCPFCITMLEDGLKAGQGQQAAMVHDLSELILKNLNDQTT
ncbi:MAG: (Fe-S)-binding protein, partial [Saprospiraceae bacterium]|nr:(Fe-S)-binding protein [Saprospiraceae bacterium]